MGTIKHFTALGRPISFNYITNRLIAYLTLAVLAGFFIFQVRTAVPTLEALASSAGLAFAVFLTWAIGREIDPAYDWSAFTALPATVVGLFILGPAGVLPLFFILLFSRILNGSTGVQAKIGDSLLLIILAVLLFTNETISAPLILAAVFFFDALCEPANRNQYAFAVVALATFFAALFMLDGARVAAEMVHPMAVATLAVLGASLLIVLKLSAQNTVFDDKNQAVIRETRVHLARLIPAVFIAGEVILQGVRALVLFYPAIFAFCGVALFHLARAGKNRRASEPVSPGSGTMADNGNGGENRERPVRK